MSLDFAIPPLPMGKCSPPVRPVRVRESTSPSKKTSRNFQRARHLELQGRRRLGFHHGPVTALPLGDDFGHGAGDPLSAAVEESRVLARYGVRRGCFTRRSGCALLAADRGGKERDESHECRQSSVHDSSLFVPSGPCFAGPGFTTYHHSRCREGIKARQECNSIVLGSYFSMETMMCIDIFSSSSENALRHLSAGCSGTLIRFYFKPCNEEK